MFGKKDPPNVDAIKAELGAIIEPILQAPLSALGFLGDIKADGTRVRVAIDLPTPAWEGKEALEKALSQGLAKVAPGAELDVAWGATVKPSRHDPGGSQNFVPGAKNVILFASGKGGVGKSTVATNVAAALSQLGANVGLLDADIYGPSIPTMFGTRKMPEVAAGGSKLTPIHQAGLKLMSIGFVVDPKEAMSWRGPMLNGALIQFMRDVDWGELDYLTLDLPRAPATCS